MISGFDPYNTILRDGAVDTVSTLSLLDMTYVGAARKKLDTLFKEEKMAINESPDN